MSGLLDKAKQKPADNKEEAEVAVVVEVSTEGLIAETSSGNGLNMDALIGFRLVLLSAFS